MAGVLLQFQPDLVSDNGRRGQRAPLFPGFSDNLGLGDGLLDLGLQVLQLVEGHEAPATVDQGADVAAVVDGLAEVIQGWTAEDQAGAVALFDPDLQVVSVLVFDSLTQ